MGYDCFCFFFFQAEDGIRDLVRSRGLGDVYKRQAYMVMMRVGFIWLMNQIIEFLFLIMLPLNQMVHMQIMF